MTWYLSARLPRAYDANNFCKKPRKNGFDAGLFSIIVFIPREAGLLHLGVRSTYILGLQIGSILSRFIAPEPLAKAEKSENKIEFFCRLECTKRLVL